MQGAALELLLRRYMKPMRAHIIHRKGLDLHSAEDLLQGFITRKVIEKELISKADRNKGKFRTFLLTALDHYIVSQYRHDNAAKRKPRGPEDSSVSAVAETADPAKHPSAEFDVAWAREVIGRAIECFSEECRLIRRPDIWGVFEGRVLRPTIDSVEPTSYDELIEKYGFQSPAQASNAMITAKRMFARTLRQVVSEYTPEGEDIDAEIMDLKRILSNARA